MKKLVSLVVLLSLATAANAAPSYVQRDNRGGYNVTYDYMDKAKTGWYITGRAEVSFLNWKNKYSSNFPGANNDFDSDDYSFEPVFGGSLAATKLSWENFKSGDGDKTSVSPMAGVMLGYTQELDDNLVLDIRYRLAGFTGTKHKRNFEYYDGAAALHGAYLENKIGLILDNSISVGIRYEF